MEAVQYDTKTKCLKLVNKEIPKTLAGNQVLVKVAYAGICGTDLHIIDGEFQCRQEPVVLGHEFVGTVVQVGKDVRNVAVLDRVAVDPNKGCMLCDFCQVGNVHFCKERFSDSKWNPTLGIFLDGGWAQYCIVPESQIFKIPTDLTLEQAALAEPMSCICHSWESISPVGIGQKILVIGSGIIGNLFLSLLHLQGHRKVTVSEPNTARMLQFQKLDTGYEIITPDELNKRAKDESYLFNLIIDCSGNANAIQNAFHLLDFGGRLCIFGVANPEATICISPFQMFKKELTIMGTTINPFTFPKSLALLQSMADRYIDYKKLGVKTFSLSDYEQAIQSLRKGEVAKAMFKL